MDINKIMTNGIFTMKDKHTVRTRTQHNTESCNHGSNLLESLINLSVSVRILLFTVKSKFSLPYNRVLRVKGAMFPIAFWSVTLGLLYRGHIRKKWGEMMLFYCKRNLWCEVATVVHPDTRSLVPCHDPGAGINPKAFGLVGNMGVMICLGHGGLRSQSALSSYELFHIQFKPSPYPAFRFFIHLPFFPYLCCYLLAHFLFQLCIATPTKVNFSSGSVYHLELPAV